MLLCNEPPHIPKWQTKALGTWLCLCGNKALPLTGSGQAQPSLNCLSFCPQSLYFLSEKTTASLKASACREQNRLVRKITVYNILYASVPSCEKQTTTLSLAQVPLFFLFMSQVSFAFCLNVCSLSPKAFLRLVPFMYLSSHHWPTSGHILLGHEAVFLFN